MNLFISNSKSKRNVILFLAIISILYLSLICIINLFVSGKTTKIAFIDDKVSKAAHMKLSMQDKEKDIIFVGNSRTLYQISTSLFAKSGYNVYNYSASDRRISDYPWMVKQAVTQHPKAIIIVTSINELFAPPLITRFPTFFDLLTYIHSHQSIKFIVNEIWAYVKSINSLYCYSTVIFERLNMFLEKITNEDYLRNFVKADATRAKNSLNKGTKFSLANLDCTPFAITKLPTKWIVKCSNGDGILLGESIETKQNKCVLESTNLNEDTVRLLNYVIASIQKRKIRTIVLLLPLANTFYEYDANLVKSKITTDVIDWSNLNVSLTDWVDHSHLNNQGRIFLSEKLLQYLQRGMLKD